MTILRGIWKIWSKLEKLATEAKSGKNSHLLLGIMKIIEVDMSWCSRFTMQQLKFFDSEEDDIISENLVQLMADLQPSDVELSYMLCQLCFHSVGKKHQREILEVMESFSEILSDQLHSYYVNVMKRSNYSNRISKMMKINNLIQQSIQRERVKNELMRIFDVFFISCSHPDLFKS
ncbi:hypothetical protein GCK72_020081 [Caenorhabditis remanei]|uniref:NR LBD domain-containing protein n=1 Tax=Caenorhabditis remanei TaxID=31234 RepID=A0A6A5GFJ4_CAERE|nr:hypothetical protein GCK72_020081 [Caenorhabditis remanei]KAF1753524.1 hypothetical protein GCK72_020081 [Caenorhabditis remanei]